MIEIPRKLIHIHKTNLFHPIWIKRRVVIIIPAESRPISATVAENWQILVPSLGSGRHYDIYACQLQSVKSRSIHIERLEKLHTFVNKGYLWNLKVNLLQNTDPLNQINKISSSGYVYFSFSTLCHDKNHVTWNPYLNETDFGQF